ncbi:MAG: methylated-DNA--[protein]-cysteine S-methyltransferase [Verrucomicrobiota bacterium]|jgi:AraC family transcriptional regulator of adaptative response/methylated-DNA-[protein]-cysteine methyltransferase
MNDYERMARVIRYLDEHQEGQPRLSALAREAGLSEFHFHRLFSAWAGTTPKNFLRCLTFARARSRLRRGGNILDSALDAGLSGPGRLHDLCVRLEAASPGEIKSGGAGWTISAGFGPSPFGRCLVAQSPRGVCHLSFVDANPRAAWNEMKELWPNARWERDDAAAGKLLRRVFRPGGQSGSRPKWTALVKGTAFQLRVWRALLRIPAGQLCSYGRLAAAVGAPAGARAVGSAVGRNELAWLIPCHRVIRETGVLGDYRWGAERKRAMIAWEAAGGRAS